MRRALLLGAMRLADSRAFWRAASLALGIAASFRRSPRWNVLAGYARERLGDWAGARARYAEAAALAKASPSAAPARWLHAAQFFLERAKGELGEPSAKDPLFGCSASPEGDSSGLRPAGYYQVEFVFSGLQVIGALAPGAARSVDLLLDGKKIRDVNVVAGRLRSSFSFKITRRSLKLFPRDCSLSVRADTGELLLPLAGGSAARLRLPMGAEGASPLVTGERRMDKKGVPVPTPQELEAERAAYLSIYAEARDFFLERFGKQLYLIYGTLLGQYRDGGFIPGDDDFDSAFMADSTDPELVKAEVLGMVLDLVEAGFSVSFNRRGRLFRLHGRGAGTKGAHIDVHSFWVQDGKVYAHNDFCAAEARGCYVPASEGILAGTRVFVPAEPEVFLADHYGPGWKVPDPGFVNYYETKDPAALAILSRALLSPAEYREALGALEARRASHPLAGEFVSIGARDLYPLTDRDEDLE